MDHTPYNFEAVEKKIDEDKARFYQQFPENPVTEREDIWFNYRDLPEQFFWEYLKARSCEWKGKPEVEVLGKVVVNLDGVKMEFDNFRDFSPVGYLSRLRPIRGMPPNRCIDFNSYDHIKLL